jgi:hypothetical protein
MPMRKTDKAAARGNLVILMRARDVPSISSISALVSQAGRGDVC